MILAKYKYSVNTFLVLCYLMQNIVDNATRLMYSIGGDRALNTKTEGRNNLMKKRISLALTVLLVLSVCILPFATHAAEIMGNNRCEIAGHPISETSTPVGKSTNKYIDGGVDIHTVVTTTIRKCSCGEKTKAFVTNSDERHKNTTRTSPHTNGGHNVVVICVWCSHVSNRYFYPCPGGDQCLYPTSIHEPY